jgi:superfamily II DNA or RNA helicase
MLQISEEAERECDLYTHDEYQAAVAGIVISHNSPFILVQMATASGKTFIQGLIAKYFVGRGMNVLILEPNDDLMH